MSILSRWFERSSLFESSETKTVNTHDLTHRELFFHLLKKDTFILTNYLASGKSRFLDGKVGEVYVDVDVWEFTDIMMHPSLKDRGDPNNIAYGSLWSIFAQHHHTVGIKGFPSVVPFPLVGIYFRIVEKTDKKKWRITRCTTQNIK